MELSLKGKELINEAFLDKVFLLLKRKIVRMQQGQQTS